MGGLERPDQYIGRPGTGVLWSSQQNFCLKKFALLVFHRKMLKTYFFRKEAGGKKMKRWVVLMPTKMSFYDKPGDLKPLDSLATINFKKVACKGAKLMFLMRNGKKRILETGTPSITRQWANTLRMLLITDQAGGKKPETTRKKGRKVEKDIEIVVSSSEAKHFEIKRFLDCAARGNLEELRKIDVDPMSKDQASNQAIHYACNGNHLNVLKFLAQEKGVDLNAPNSSGDTPMHRCAWKGSFQCCQFLIVSGARFDIKNKEGRMAVDMAQILQIKSLLESVVPSNLFDEEDDGSQDFNEDDD